MMTHGSELQSLENLDDPSTSSGSNFRRLRNSLVIDGALLVEPDEDNSSESDDEINEEWNDKVDFLFFQR